MNPSKYEMERFNGKNDFALWKIKMRAILIEKGLLEAIEPEDQSKKEATDDSSTSQRMSRAEMDRKAHSAIILCLSDKVLREVSKERTAAGVWIKLESLYMTKSLANRLYMKQRLYSLKFTEDRSIEDQMDDFCKSVDDIESIDEEIRDEDKAILLLNALPKSYEHVKDVMIFGRESTISLEEVQNALRAKEMQKIHEGKKEPPAKGLNIKKYKGKKKKSADDYKKKDYNKSQDSKDSKGCFECGKPGHLRKNCYIWKRKQKELKCQPSNNADNVQETREAEVLNVMQGDAESKWILDSACSFHMCPTKNLFCDLEMEKSGSVLLGNNQVCHVKGIGCIKFKMHDGSIKIISEVRYIPELKEISYL